ncbi:MAG: redoxin domain-containing protein, partial [Caulobacterales bacterium]|nr:redoxin domain-containing protein [Caulobacterales bacterium]
MASDDRAPVTLARGAYIPYFALPNQDGERREIHLFAGRPLALMLLPAEAGVVKAHLAAHGRLHKELRANDIRTVIVVRAAPEAAAALRAEAGSTMSFWADADGAVARAFGLGPEEAGMALADANLKIAHLRRSEDPDAALAALVDIASERLGRSSAMAVRAHAPIMVIPEALSAEMCARIVDHWRGGAQYQGAVGSAGGQKVKASSKVRADVNINDRGLLAAVDAALGARVFPEVRKVGSLTVTHRERYKIGCYPAEAGGHFKEHRDTPFLSLANRRYSLVVCLNEDYTGGGLVF